MVRKLQQFVSVRTSRVLQVKGQMRKQREKGINFQSIWKIFDYLFFTRKTVTLLYQTFRNVQIEM